MSHYRPSGPLHWFLNRINPRDWSCLGCLGTEERSLSALRELNSESTVSTRRLLRIKDKPSRFRGQIQAAVGEREAEFLSLGGTPADVVDVDLFAQHGEIVSVLTDFVDAATESVVLDVSSLPKRFFFPFLRQLYRTDAARVKDIVVTYGTPIRYPEGPLAENFNDWAHLPLFGGKYSAERPSMLVVSVGFQALGIQEQLKGEPEVPIKLLLPFPAPTKAFQRSWELLRQLRHNRNAEAFETFRASANSVSDTFDRLVSLTDGGQKVADLAPFGPKPMSVAMCLFASLTESQVFYTQPSVYRPDYSSGAAHVDGHPVVHAFAIRLAGRDLYSLL